MATSSAALDDDASSESRASSSLTASSSSSSLASASDASSSSSEDAEEEPILKYRRLGGSAPELLSSDLATCACAAEGLIALGTKSGRVHILDADGVEIRRFAPHAGPVNDVSLDARAEFVASCAEDGTVAVHGLRVDERILREHSAPVRTVALDPDFASRRARRFARGGADGALVLNARTGAGQRGDLTLHAGEGTVHLARWAGDLIAWANDVGVKVYDVARDRRVAFVDRPRGSPPPDAYRPHLAWDGGDKTLIIAWADCVKIARVGTKVDRFASGSGAGSGAGSGVPTLGGGGGGGSTSGAGGILGGTAGGLIPSIRAVGTFGAKNVRGAAAGEDDDRSPSGVSRFVEIVAVFQTDYFISGVAPFGDALIVLAHVTDDDEDDDEDEDEDEDDVGDGSDPKPRGLGFEPARRRPSRRPEVRVVTRRNEDISRDALGVRGYETLGANDYRLCACAPSSSSSSASSSSAATSTAKDGDWIACDAPAYFVVSPRDVVAGRPRTAEDRVRWLVDAGDFESALRACEDAEASGTPIDPSVLGVRADGLAGTSIARGGTSSARDAVAAAYLDRTLRSGDADGAAALCPRLLRGDAAAWERWVFHFAHLRALRSLAPYLPTENPTLNPVAYEVALNAFLADPADHARFLACVRSWPPRLYGVPALVAATRRRIGDAAEAKEASGSAEASSGNASSSSISSISSISSSAAVLKEALAELYLADGQRERALALHLELGRPNVLDFIARHGLLASAKDRIPQLAAMDPPRAAALLVSQRDAVPPDVVAAKLADAAKTGERGARRILHLYLRALFAADPFAGEAWHGAQTRLYAEFHPEELLDFLRRATGYDLNDALEACEGEGRERERVYLLGRVGAARTALRVLVEDLRDVPGAVAFAQEHAAGDPDDPDDPGDDELWDELIALVTTRRDLGDRAVGELLDAAGRLVDPTRVLARTPAGWRVDGLRERLAGILAESRAGERGARQERTKSREKLVGASARCVDETRRAYAPRRVVVLD